MSMAQWKILYFIKVLNVLYLHFEFEVEGPGTVLADDWSPHIAESVHKIPGAAEWTVLNDIIK